MAEYISRDAAIEEIDKWLDTVGTVLVGKGLSYYGELIGCIEDTPAADVAPVVHGRWVGVDSSYWRWTPSGAVAVEHITYCCERCGYGTVVKTHYCPNCGAKMNGGIDNG